MTEPLTPPDCDLTDRAIVFSHTPRLIPEKAVFRPALALCPLPGSNGTSMTKMTYAEQLRHPNWQRRRLERLSLADFACDGCGDKNTTLNVHHERYVKGRMAWEYGGHELAVLCEPCHEKAHHRKAVLERMLLESQPFGSTAVEFAIGLLGGYLDAMDALPPDLSKQAKEIGGPTYLAGIFGFYTETRLHWPTTADWVLREMGSMMAPQMRTTLQDLVSDAGTPKAGEDA